MKSARTYLPSLDGIRALALLMVMAHNAILVDPGPLGPVGRLVYKALDTGWVGVTLFFALSGFLITRILLDTREEPGAWRHFMVRRTLRIFPLYYLTLALFFIVLPVLGLQPDSAAMDAPHQWWLWTYTVNWSKPEWSGSATFPHFWSLAVEEQFYLVWPLFMLNVRTPRQAGVVCLVTAAICLVCRIKWGLMPGHEEQVYDWTTTRMDALALGGLGAVLLRSPASLAWLRQHGAKVGWSLLLVFVVAGLYTKAYPRTSVRGMLVGHTVFSVVFAWCVTWAALLDMDGVRTWWHRALHWAPLRHIGVVSYGMYVIHKPLHNLGSAHALAWLNWPAATLGGGLVHLAGLVGVTYLLARLSYRFIELPFLRLKDKWA
jgi:peptidoglycan/LPS O-acetylase OafA/YrhL